MHQVSNFITPEECVEFIKMIDANHGRSSVVEGGTDLSTISDHRTSSTCNLDHTNPLVQKLHQKIADYLGINIAKGEHLQGQLYEPGQYFKPHNDFFSGPAYDKHCLYSGNRTDTLMLYLNEDFEGGTTNFPAFNASIKAETGKAFLWRNMIKGEVNTNALHEGSPVTKGKKYIITSWWRENLWNNGEDTKMWMDKKEAEEKAKAEKNIVSQVNIIKENPKTYTDASQLPRLTEKGFEVKKVPEKIWAYITEAYHLLKETKREEHFEGKENIIVGGGSDILSFEAIPTIRSLIHEQLLPIHEEFSGVKITPSFVYGIRSYLRGATLTTHVDRVATHHVSSIIIVDKNLACGCQHKDLGDDWALDIQDHQGEWHKVYAQPGEMILYESAVCAHGRVDPFQGTFFRNFYVHYQLA